MTGAVFLAVGGIYVLNILLMAAATAILIAVAVWGIQPRQRWRKWREQARAA